MNLARQAGIALAATAAVGLAVAPAANASAPSVSDLTVTQSGSPVTAISIDVSKTPSATVTLALDDNCPTVYGTGQDYGIAVSSSMPGVVTVSPTSINGLQCDSQTPFTITGVANGRTTLQFDSVAKNSGLQKKLGNASLVVTVTGASTSVNPGEPAPQHKRPAAPAVANAYLNEDALVAACKSEYATAGHHWHGALIKAVAKWSRDNHYGKLKNDRDLFPTDDSWIKTAQGEVNTLCNYQPAPTP